MTPHYLRLNISEILIARKWLGFQTPPVFELECRDEIWHQKTRIVGLPDVEEIMTLAFFSFFSFIQYRLATDRQTDGHVALA